MSTHYVDCDMCGEEIGSAHEGYMTKQHPECKPFAEAVVLSTLRVDTSRLGVVELFTQREIEEDLFYTIEYLIFDLRESYRKPFTRNSYPEGGM